MQAVVLAGGLGTRLRPLTNRTPKPLLPLMGVPFAYRLIRQLAESGVTSATLLVGADPAPWREAGQIGAALGVRVETQPEQAPLGTAGGCRLLFLRRPPAGPVIVCNADVLSDFDCRNLVKAHRGRGVAATVAVARAADPSSFGVLVLGENGLGRRYVEKPPAGTEAADTVNIGMYVLDPGVFAGLDGDGPLSFEHDVLPALIARRSLLGVVTACYWQDLGTLTGYLGAHRAVLDGRCRWPVPAEVEVTAGVRAVHATARVAGAQIGPMAVIGARSVVEPGARVVNSVLHEDVAVGPDALIVDSVLGEGTRIAPGTQVTGRLVAAQG
ncbi:MAG TPA: NDP-sugar synthase [Streptosporangiaceae bacterium]|nr:NDP-sugar synthase [Streptosporangiaceae bacterium]